MGRMDPAAWSGRLPRLIMGALALAAFLVGTLVLVLTPAGELASAQIGQERPDPVPPPTALPVPIPGDALWVLDPHADSMGLSSEVLAVDPQTGSVPARIPTRYSPDAVLSPDGKLLYVADTYFTRGNRGDAVQALTVYDATTGQIVVDDVRMAERLMYKLYPTFRTLYLSPDGATLYLLKYGPAGAEGAIRVAALETGGFQTRWEATLDGCGIPRLLPSRDRGWLYAACSTGMVSPIEVRSGRSQLGLALPVASVNGQSLIASVLADERLLTATSDGRIVEVKVDRGRLALAGERRLDVPAGAPGPGIAVFSPDGGRLLAGFRGNQRHGSGLSGEVAAFDVASGRRLWSVRPSVPAFTISLSRDGNQAYLANPFDRTVLVLDPQTGRESQAVRNLGRTPTAIIHRGD